MTKLKLPKWLSFSLFISFIILCLIPTIPLFFLSDEPSLINQALYSMSLNDQTPQPKDDDHPITPSPGNTDLTKPKSNPK
uniref:F-ORF n=1 Tax=Schistodesmus spinosus TaxID=232577 RepID=UPI0021CCDC93|nr:F-ORF [Schistodesmus spinosus]UWM10807.1 F-ORF [Schistodesmus spinosus]